MSETPPEAPMEAPQAGAQPQAEQAEQAEQQQQPAPQPVWSLRRVIRTASSESWHVLADDSAVAKLQLHYTTPGIEGVIAVSGDPGEDGLRTLLAWVTETLALDAAAGPAGLIHWTTVRGEVAEFWRRSPGRRASGADSDLAAVRARVETVLGSLFGGFGQTPDGDLAVDVGSVRVFVAIRLVDTTVAVRVFSITNVGLRPDGDLAAYLLSLNFGMLIGRFSLDPAAHAVWFDHVLTSDELDDGALGRVVAAIAGTADRYDDEIKQRFGGRTFREEGSPVETKVELTANTNMAGGYL